MYSYDEVKKFFKSDSDVVVFKMSSVRCGVVFYNKTITLEENSQFFRVGKYTLYLHEQTEKFIVASLPIF